MLLTENGCRMEKRVGSRWKGVSRYVMYRTFTVLVLVRLWSGRFICVELLSC